MKWPITKGNWYYEIQILMLVFMWQHDMTYKPRSKSGLRLGRLYIWCDSAWRDRGKVGDFLWDLTKNVKLFKSKRVKLNVLLINAKNMFVRWINSRKLVKFIRSLQSYLRLSQAGFEIGYWRDPDLRDRYERYRFFWKEKLVREMPDIVCVDNNYSTVNNGHQEQLGVHMFVDDFKNFTTNHDGHDI